ncbi:hypothetical protein D9M71_480140 [compost metagenome]
MTDQGKIDLLVQVMLQLGELGVKLSVGNRVIGGNQTQLELQLFNMLLVRPRTGRVNAIDRHWLFDKADQAVSSNADIHDPVIRPGLEQLCRQVFQRGPPIQASREVAHQIVRDQITSAK